MIRWLSRIGPGSVKYFDAEIGLHYNYFRDYEPATGRYVQSDPIGQFGGLSTYGYAQGTPLVRFDPNGLCTIVGQFPVKPTADWDIEVCPDGTDSCFGYAFPASITVDVTATGTISYSLSCTMICECGRNSYWSNDSDIVLRASAEIPLPIPRACKMIPERRAQIACMIAQYGNLAITLKQAEREAAKLFMAMSAARIAGLNATTLCELSRPPGT